MRASLAAPPQALATDDGQQLVGMESASVCGAIAAAAFCAQRIGGSPKRRSVLADGAPTGSRCRDAVGRAQPLTAASLKPGAVQSGRSARRAVEPLGEFDDQAFGSADVAEEVDVLVVDDLPDRVPASLSDAVTTPRTSSALKATCRSPGRFAPAPALELRRKAIRSAPPRTCRCRRAREPSPSRSSRSRDR